MLQGARLAEITEDVDAANCARAGNLLDCRGSTINVPSYESGLVIFLRRDGSTIKGGNIKNAVLGKEIGTLVEVEKAK